MRFPKPTFLPGRCAENPLQGFFTVFLTLALSLFSTAEIFSSPVEPIVDPLSEEAAPEPDSRRPSLFDLDIDRLGQVDVVPSFDIPVTSVEKKESTVGRSPAAVYVITDEMIHRSGATTIPDVLRLAPGVEVSQVNSYTWAVSIRGFNDRYSNKLLVMIDGRSVYNPVFNGVLWEMQDLILDDIERIEVVRGPGGTLWGANAVNGVINIITKSADQTQGTYLSSGGGSHDRSINNLRYGGQVGEELHYRLWGRHFERGPEASDGRHDDWRMGHGGFRVDWTPKQRCCYDDRITVQGDYLGGERGVDRALVSDQSPFYSQSIVDRGFSENNLLARWTRTYDDQNDWALQTYYDQVYYENVDLQMTVHTFDVDFQQRFSRGNRQSWIWGTEYRWYSDHLPSDSDAFQFSPESRAYDTISGFVQDEIELVDDRLSLTLGSKFEHNSFTGFEYQPSARALWTLNQRNVAWAAISRAVRTPSRVDMNAAASSPILDHPFPISALFYKGDDLISEDLLAYEIGYRNQTTDRFSWDVTLFYNVYRNLFGFEKEAPYMDGGVMILPLVEANRFDAQTYGFEWTASWELTKQWRLGGSYSFIRGWDSLDPGMQILPGIGSAYQGPSNQVRLQSYWSPLPGWQLDAFLRYVDRLEEVPDYVTMDLRLGWRPRKNVEFSVVGQNLFSPAHTEAAASSFYSEPGYEIERAVFGKVTWTY